MAYGQQTIPDSPQNSSSSYRNNWWSRTPGWVKWTGMPLAAGFAGMAILLGCLRLVPLPDGSIANPTTIDGEDGSTLADWTLKGTRAEHIPLVKIPMALQQATLAVEDVHFYHHRAFQFSSMIRAALVDLKHGHVVEGGSTITQQLAKNLFLPQDRTILRKVKEALYAMQLELHESKSTILEQYLNIVYYGHGAYGVQAAAELYFNKPVDELNLAECTMLAGLPKGPAYYSPITHFSAAKARQRIVLDRMVAAGYLTRDEAEKVYNTPIHISTVHPPLEEAPYFTTTAIHEAEQRFHLTSETLYAGDVHIRTTLDPVLQQAAERAIATTIPKHGNLQAALVALDPETGAIRAMVGGRDYATSPYNRVFAERQPGSTFKAVLYSAALEDGWSPARQVNSQITTFLYDESKLYTVHDYGNIYAHRPLTLREALARSDNVYAVTTNLDVGPTRVMNMARRMGITSPLMPYPALALGVFPVSPLEMATAYATLANGGKRIVPYTVDEVEAPKSGVLAQSSPQPDRVMTPQLTFQMSDLLRSVMEPNGTGYASHSWLHGPAAAKTGTTDTDGWMVGYTPKLVCAVWVGYDNNRPLNNAESHMAGPIWAKFMGTAQQRLPSDWYKAPSGLVARVIDPVTAKLATDTCRTTETDYFKEGTEPTEYCPLHAPTKPHSPVQVAHSWLYRFVHKWW